MKCNSDGGAGSNRNFDRAKKAGLRRRARRFGPGSRSLARRLLLTVFLEIDSAGVAAKVVALLMAALRAIHTILGAKFRKAWIES